MFLNLQGFFFVSLWCIKTSFCDWVKLPQINTPPKVTYKITSLAELPASFLSHSDVVNTVFSYQSTPTNAPTRTPTEMTLLATSTYQQSSKIKKYFPSTVTSTTINIAEQISDKFDHEVLGSESPIIVRKKIIYMNQTIPMEVTESAKMLTTTEDYDEADDDGVVVMDDDENLSEINEEVSDEDYYYESEPSTTSTTTTKAPKSSTKAHRKFTKAPMKPQRRVMQVVKANPLSFANFIKFLKTIQNSFASKTAKNINDKIQMLREFRDNLILNINTRIKSLFRTQSEKANKSNSRPKRTLGGGGSSSNGWMENGGGMDFPSAEGALLSISFLTFAVFLIKLVLQVIQTIKMKKMQWGTQMDPNGIQTANAVVIKRNRNARKVSLNDPNDVKKLTRILDSIENLKMK